MSGATRTPGHDGRPMRVLHFITGFGFGGSEHQTVRLVRGLSRYGFDVHLACFRKEGGLLGQVAGYPCEEFALPSFRHPRAASQALRFTRFLRRHDFDVVHTTGLHPNVFAAPLARLAGVPAVVAAIRDLGDPWTAGERRAQRVGCRFAHEVLVNAGAVRDQLVDEGYDRDRIGVIHNAVTPPPTADPSDPLHEEFGVPRHVPVIGVVARMVRVKGIEYFVEAAARLAPRFPEARFVLVGGPIPGAEVHDGSEYEEELHALVAARGLGGRVIFAGDRPDVPRFLRRFTVSVLPSLSEGLPNALLESLAAGVPSVATRVGGTPEIIDNGASGLLVPPRDAGLLADAVERLLLDPDLADALGRAGKKRVATHFTETRLIERTRDRYLRLLAGTRRDPATEGGPSDAPTWRRSSPRPGGSRSWSWHPVWRRR